MSEVLVQMYKPRSFREVRRLDMTISIDADFTQRAWENWTAPEVATVDGLETAYRRHGAGETVVYLHGEGQTRAWSPFHDALAQGADVIAPEHPGFGDTPRPAHFDTWDDWILHYDAFFRELGLDRFHLVGHSLGGMLAAKLAITYPERFQSVTLVTPQGLRLLDEPLRNPFRWDEREANDALFNGRKDNYSSLLTQEGSPEDEIQAYKELTTVALLMWNPRYDIKFDHRLARIRAPFLSIGVDEDGVTGNAMAQRFADLVPGGAYLRLSGPSGAPSSHMVVVEQPHDTAAAILDRITSASKEV